MNTIERPSKGTNKVKFYRLRRHRLSGGLRTPNVRDAPRRWMLGAALVLYGYKSAVQVKDVGVGTRNIHFHFNSFAFAEFD